MNRLYKIKGFKGDANQGLSSMCGIFGSLTPDVEQGLDYLLTGLVFNYGRGQDTLCGMVINAQSGHAVREYTLFEDEGSFKTIGTALRKHADKFSQGPIVCMGHNRYRTSSNLKVDNIQPIIIVHEQSGREIYIAHNGQIEEPTSCSAFNTKTYLDPSHQSECRADSDTRHLGDFYLRQVLNGKSGHEAIREIMRHIRGGYSCVLWDKEERTLYGFSDPQKFWPLHIGQKNGTTILTSESGYFNFLHQDSYNFSIREVKPGEIISLRQENADSFNLDWTQQLTPCLMNGAYVQHPLSQVILSELTGQELRYRLAQGHYNFWGSRINVEIFIPVRHSGDSYGQQFSVLAHLLSSDAMRKISSTRLFIQPEGGRDKPIVLNNNEVYQRRIGLPDDSVVRLDTATRVGYYFTLAQAKSLQFLIMVPPIHTRCTYGLYTPTREELIGYSLVQEGIIPENTVDYSRGEQGRKTMEAVSEFIGKKLSERIERRIEKEVAAGHIPEKFLETPRPHIDVLYNPPHVFVEAFPTPICMQCITGISPYA